LIPHQILGRGGRCRHCGHLFRAQVPGAPDEVLSSSPPSALDLQNQDGHDDTPHLGLFRGLESVYRRLVAKVGARASELQRLNPRRWPVVPWRQSPQRQEKDDPAPAPGQRALDWKQDWEAARGTLDELRSELSAVREQAAQTERLKQELRADLAEIEQIRAQLKEAYPLVIDPNSQAALEKIRELETLRAECGRLHEEANVLRSQLETQATETRQQCNQLTTERDSACAERDWWKAERAAIERELEQTRDLFGAERDAIGREVDQLEARLEELERLQDEAGCEHQRERASWENERAELREEAERQRGALFEAEDHLSQQRVGFEVERQSWRRQLEEHARRTAEHEARLGEVEQLHERTGHERDALVRRVEQLQGDLAKSERLRASIQLELDQARAAWKAHRRESQAHWEQQRRDLLAEAELRIKDQEAGFAVERQSWNHRLEEHAQMAAVWESLAQEVEQVQAGLMEGRDALTQEVRQLREQLAESEKSRTEAEHGLDELRGQLEVERQSWCRQLDEHVRTAAEREARLGEVEQLHERTGRERDVTAQLVERLRDRVTELEREPAAAESDPDEARAAWEAERRELQLQWEEQRQGLLAEAERRLDELRGQVDVERQARRQEADTNRALESRREEAAALHGALEGTRRERDAALQQVAALGPERDRLRTRLDESEAARRESERRHLAERDRLVAALEQAREASEAAARLRAEQADALRVMRTELERRREEHEALEARTRRNLVALRREWDNERRCWLEMLGAGRPDAAQDSPLPIPALATPPHGDSLTRSTAAIRSRGGTAGRDAESTTPVSSPSNRSDRPLSRRGVAMALPSRPQACSYYDPEAFRTHLEQWLAEARTMSANPGRPANPAFCHWLDYEIRTAREEIALVVREQAADRKDATEVTAVPLQPA
jgi:chromosome segregation ATPase